MENSYGIGVRNRYELFYDEDIDPMDLIKQTEKIKDKGSEKENKGKTPKAKAPAAAKKGTKTEAPPKIADKTSAPAPVPRSGSSWSGAEATDEAKSPQQRGPRPNDGRVKFSDREERNNRRNRQEGGEYREGPPPPRFDGEGRGGGGGMGRGRARGMGRGRGRGRGGPGGIPGGVDSRGKREYDRQSGMATTGVKPMDKREGSGSFNWGSDRDQIEEQLNATPNELDTSAETPEKAPEEGAAPAEGEEAAKEDDNAKEMTLDEWKAMQGTRNKPAFNIRRAGEGENQAQWKKTYVLKKKIEESDEEEEEEEEEEVHHGRKKVLLPIDFQFADSPGRGRGRGRGRGGPGRGRGDGIRGGRGGGGDRGERGEREGGGRGGRGGERGTRGGPGSRGGRGVPRQQEAPKMDDERDFPSLG
ncbi:plasminogen activator inhibitor 1 RNA-binding protein-like isoform X1 [Eriocheir sinensis]|uniref:plasminogen activator inhibitor 1 RNA-binding protein-like isoform X1 n=1 Tax=Eriocheir sinensis TaxID=95602 RepID=UPI0021C59B4E|nr:plasminogen activator inhibitor 1 RNA-binding protein-like isoform X1 [Eriocheir sinensis]